jgi:uncharacterized protein YukE
MKKLSKEQLKQHADLSTELHGAHEALDEAIEQYNKKVVEAFAAIHPFIEQFNSKVEEVNAFIEEIHAEQESYFDEKSERWQDGDAGSAYSDWMSMWELAVEEVELEEPSELEMPEVEDSFEQLDTECS